MAYSSIPAAKAQLLTTLAARPALAGVLVAWGMPAEPPPQREAIYILDAVNVQREWAQLGQLRIDESYTLRVLVEVYQEGECVGRDDQRVCEERMWAIVAEVEQAIVADLTLASVLAGPGHAKPGPVDPRCFPVHDGWVAEAPLQIQCRARIGP